MAQPKFKIGSVVKIIGQHTLMTVEGNHTEGKHNVVWFDKHDVILRDVLATEILELQVKQNGE